MSGTSENGSGSASPGPRVVRPDRERFTDPEELAAYDAVMVAHTEERKYPNYEYAMLAPPLDYFGALLHSPLLAKAVDETSDFYRSRIESGGAGWTNWDKEWADLVISQDLGNNVVWAHHVDAERRGLRPEAIRALRSGGRDEVYTPEERRIIEYCRAVLHGTVTDEQFADLKEHFGERGAVEFTFFVALLTASARVMKAFRLPAPTDAEIDRILDELANQSANA